MSIVYDKGEFSQVYYIYEPILPHKINLINILTIEEVSYSYGQKVILKECGFRLSQGVVLKYPIKNNEDCLQDTKSGQFAVGVEISNGSPPTHQGPIWPPVQTNPEPICK